MVREVAVDHDGLGRLIEIVLDLLELRDLGAFGDVERAILEGEAIRAVKPGGDHLGLALGALRDDRIDLVAGAVADEHGALVAEPERARIHYSGNVGLDLEALRYFELRRRQLVFRAGSLRLREAADAIRNVRCGWTTLRLLRDRRKGGQCQTERC